jgi:hypothetical protein
MVNGGVNGKELSGSEGDSKRIQIYKGTGGYDVKPQGSEVMTEQGNGNK